MDLHVVGDFQDRIRELRDRARPDVLFAESVGSCVDLVGPVLRPLSASADGAGMRVTYSVFADIRLLRRRLLDLPMPFSDNICYIFDKQLEETDVVVINKADLLSHDDGLSVFERARHRFPEKSLLLQSSLTPEGVGPWLDVLGVPHPLTVALALDYAPYIAGAAELAWFDDCLTFALPEGEGRALLVRLFGKILDGLQRAACPVAHLKFSIRTAEVTSMFSITAADEAGWEGAMPELPMAPVTLIINARVQTEAERLRELVTKAVCEVLSDAGVTYRTSGATAYAPQVPT